MLMMLLQKYHEPGIGFEFRGQLTIWKTKLNLDIKSELKKTNFFVHKKKGNKLCLEFAANWRTKTCFD